MLARCRTEFLKLTLDLVFTALAEEVLHVLMSINFIKIMSNIDLVHGLNLIKSMCA